MCLDDSRRTDADYRIAERLRRTWDAFFARFGRLTDVQRSAILPVLDGADVLVCAPTASGKTEAVCAPLVERLLRQGGAWTVLYVCPTRALVNDLYERLTGPVALLGLALKRRTGDHHDLLGDGAHLLITTPESFDSLLCRGRLGDAGHVLSGVEAVVLDEVHLLYGTPRGEQLRWLLHRLARLRAFAKAQRWCKRSGFQRVALSATVARPDDVVAAYMPGGTSVSVPGGRDIDAVLVDAASPAVEDQLPAYLDTLEAPEKILVFCNQRKRVDTLAVSLRDALEERGYAVRAHHGSLAREERETTESDIRQLGRVVVFSTSTLEIGIDIGDIDLVVLDGPPPDVSALLQRIGRGNRRTGRTRVMQCSGSTAEMFVHGAMLSAARDGELFPEFPGPHFAVVRQQLASYIFQGPRRARSRTSLVSFASEVCPDCDAGALIDHLVAEQDLEESGDGVRLGSQWLDATRLGEIHSNIESSGGEHVVDVDSGRSIATGVRFKGGSGLAVAGNLLHVRERSDWQLFVRRVSDPKLARGQWSYVSRAWMTGAGQPQAVRRYLGFAADQWPVLEQDIATMVFHFGGTRRRALLELLLNAEGLSSPAVRVDTWKITFTGWRADPPSWITGATPALLALRIPGSLGKLERWLARPGTNRHLPPHLRVREVEGWLNLEAELTRAIQAKWVRPASDRQSDALLLLAQGLDE